MTTSDHTQLSPDEMHVLLRMLDDELAAEKRDRERISRQRRVARIEDMKDQVRALGHVAFTLPLLSDSDEVWDAFLDDDAQRIRALLRQLSPVVREVQSLIREKEELQRLLQENELVIHNIKTLLESDDKDGWISDLRRWKAMARVAFKPWGTDHCIQEVARLMQTLERDVEQVENQSMRESFLGWEENRLLDRSEPPVLHFQLRKTFRDTDFNAAVDTTARLFTDPKLFAQVVHGDKARASVDVLQEVSPSMRIALYHERHHDATVTYHCLVLIARVDTDHGVTLIIQSISDPDVEELLRGACDVWTSSLSMWIHWRQVATATPRDCPDFRVTSRGTIGGAEACYAQRWQYELISALVRADAAITGTPLVELADP